MTYQQPVASYNRLTAITQPPVEMGKRLPSSSGRSEERIEALSHF